MGIARRLVLWAWSAVASVLLQASPTIAQQLPSLFAKVVTSERLEGATHRAPQAGTSDPCDALPADTGGFRVTPDRMTLALGEVRPLRLVNQQGVAVTSVQWALSDTIIAELVEDGSMAVRTLAPGAVCVTATTPLGSAKATLTVASATTLPLGTPRWSLAKTSTDPDSGIITVASQGDGSEPAAMFAIELESRPDSYDYSVTVRAVDRDGLEQWRRLLTSGSGVGGRGDLDSGLVLVLGNVVVRLDGATGAETWRYTSASSLNMAMTFRSDGTLFMFEVTESPLPFFQAIDAMDLIGIDGTTGVVTHRVPMPTTHYVTTNHLQYPPRLSNIVTMEDDTVAVLLSTWFADEASATSSSELSVMRLPTGGAATRQSIRSRPDDLYEYYPIDIMPHGDNLLIRWSDFEAGGDCIRAKVSNAGVVEWGLSPYGVSFVDGLGYGYEERNEGIVRIDLSTGAVLWTAGGLADELRVLSTRNSGGVVALDSDGKVRRYDELGVRLDFPGESGAVVADSLPQPVGDELLAVDSTNMTAYAAPDELWGLWQTREGNPSRQMTAPRPRLSASTDQITRGESVRLRVLGGAAVGVSNWTFAPQESGINAITRAGGSSTATTWNGTVVTAGTVSVTVGSGASSRVLKHHIQVAPRTRTDSGAKWTYTPPEPEEVPNGTNGFSLPDPPAPGTHVGYYLLAERIVVTAAPVVDDGPNHGLRFTTAVENTSSFKYAIIASLKAPSPFFVAQCGNFDPVTRPQGFVSGARLLANAIHHESGKTPQSHYDNFVTSVSDPSNDPTILAETIVVLGDGQAHLDKSSLMLSPLFNRTGVETKIEPCNGLVNYDSANNCQLTGNINFLPYAACTP